MVPIRARHEVRKKFGSVRNSGCRMGGFAIWLLGAMGSNRLFASKSPSKVPLRSKITEPFQVSALACLLGLAHSGLESRRTDTPGQSARDARTFPKINHENTTDSTFSTDFCRQSLRMSTAAQELCEILETGRCISAADGPLMAKLARLARRTKQTGKRTLSRLQSLVALLLQCFCPETR